VYFSEGTMAFREAEEPARLFWRKQKPVEVDMDWCVRLPVCPSARLPVCPCGGSGAWVARCVGRA
jgi:hypothetical protein